MQYCLEFVQECVALDPKITCYFVQKDFPQTLLKLIDHYDIEVRLLALTLIADTIQHYPQSLSFYRERQG